jgi:hypothetical protein
LKHLELQKKLQISSILPENDQIQFGDTRNFIYDFNMKPFPKIERGAQKMGEPGQHIWEEDRQRYLYI